MANRRTTHPVIPFDYEPENPTAVEYIKHQLRVRAQNNEDTVEERIPKLNEDASPGEILQFLTTFQRVRRTMGWTTGPKLYQKFPVHLSAYRKYRNPVLTKCTKKIHNVDRNPGIC